MDVSKLKPCPFCGGEPILHTREMRDRDDATVECGRDRCQAMIYGDTEADAIAAWNRRAPSSLTEENARLREVLKAARDLIDDQWDRMDWRRAGPVGEKIRAVLSEVK